MADVLLVEDDDDVAFALGRLLARMGHDTRRARSIADARIMLVNAFDLALVDLSLPDGDAVPWLGELARVLPFVVLSGRDEARAAVAALRAGAVDYLVKPFSEDALLIALTRVLERDAMRKQLEALRRDSGELENAVGTSRVFRGVLEAASRAAQASRTPVFIQGESGTGKEVVARLLHRASPRRDKPFVAVNAACFNEQLIESELFGHEAGAFTDARSARKGVFELAHGGTLFLDEIGELPLSLQARLLRVLEGQTFRRVGGEKEITTDVRLISATNRTLEDAVQGGRFRADLFHRVRVYTIDLPPLRDRPEDVRVLAEHFVRRFSQEMGIRDAHLAEGAVAALESHQWPGNVRELRNVIERSLVNARGGDIEASHLGLAAPGSPFREGGVLLSDIVQRHVLDVYRDNSQNISATARALGITRNVLKRKLDAYGVRIVD